MRACVTDYLRNRSKNFPKLGTKLGVKNVRNVARPFFRFLPVFPKTDLLCDKKPLLAIVGSFWNVAENPFRGFSLNFSRMCQKILLKDRTVVSPGKIRYFWDFGWSYIQKLTSTTQIFYLGIAFEISISYGQPPHFFSTFLVRFLKIAFFVIF